MKQNTYNGLKNRSTWNVSLWINNDYGLYSSAVEFMKTYEGKKPYVNFIDYMYLRQDKTPDGIKWISKLLDYKELNEFMNEFNEH